MAKSIFEQIKKQNGERFAKAIRGYDSGIFDIPGIAGIVKHAGDEAEPIMEYLESLKEVHIEETGAYQDPLTLLDKAGYNAYYVTNLEEQNRIRGYYAEGEALCTFRDPHRFERYHIINAVKKNVNQIRREDFIGKEQREDEYGTSVISIQILKTGGFISIKNRYNHTVPNPDNTFSSNPDRIISGLANSLRHHFQTDFSARQVQLPEGYMYINGQVIRYNYEQDNVYFGPDFYVKDAHIHRLKDHEIMLDSYIFDMRDKSLTYPASLSRNRGGNIELTIPGEEAIFEFEGSFFRDSEADIAFKEAFLNEIKGHKVILKKDKDGQHLLIRRKNEKNPTKDTEILIVKDGAITSLNLPTTTKIEDFFLSNNKLLKSFIAPNLKIIKNFFLNSNKDLQILRTPLLEQVGKNFLYKNTGITHLNLPNLKNVNDHFLHHNTLLEEFLAPKLTHAGNEVLFANQGLKTLSLPELIDVGCGFLGGNTDLKFLFAPKLKSTGYCFLDENLALETLDLPSIEKIGDHSLDRNKILSRLNLPSVKKLGVYFCQANTELTSLDFPSLLEIGDYSFFSNKKLKSFTASRLIRIGDYFLGSCRNLTDLYLPAVEIIGDNFLVKNMELSDLDLPAVKKIGCNFMMSNRQLSSFYAPLVERMGHNPFWMNTALQTFYAPLLREKPNGLLNFHPGKAILWQEHAKRPETKRAPEKPSVIKAPQGGSSRSESTPSIGQETTPNSEFLKELRDRLIPQK